MARRTLKTLTFLLTLGMLGACASDEEDDDGASEACPSDSALRYANFGAPFVATYCTSCHGGSVASGDRGGAPAEQVFDTVAQIRARSSRMVSEVSVQKSMPYGSASAKPTDEARQQFAEWMACGAPE